MSTLNQPDQKTLVLAAGDILTVIADADSSGSVERLARSAGGASQSYAVIAADSTHIFGPYPAAERFTVRCEAGFLTYGSAALDMADYVADAIDTATLGLKADAVAPLTDSTTGTPAASLVDVTTTGLADPDKVNDNFASLNAQIEELKAALVAAGTLTASA